MAGGLSGGNGCGQVAAQAAQRHLPTRLAACIGWRVASPVEGTPTTAALMNAAAAAIAIRAVLRFNGKSPARMHMQSVCRRSALAHKAERG